MIPSNLIRPLAWCLPILAPAARGLEIRDYDPADHDRFTNFPAAPVVNPDQLFAGRDLSGVGWFVAEPDIQMALVSRRHLLFANHFYGAVAGGEVRFLNAAGTTVTRTIAGRNIVTLDGEASDLVLVRLDSPIDPASGVSPLPYLDLADPTDAEGETIGIVGRGPVLGGTGVVGRDVLEDVETFDRTIDYGGVGVLTNRYCHFDFPLNGGTADEGLLQSGDSGSPTFVDWSGTAALVGVHSYISFIDTPGPNDKWLNYDLFVPRYVDQLNLLLAPEGYRMRPVNAPITTLAGITATVQDPPRRARPLTLVFTLGNIGGDLTGNVEVEFDFAPGEEPDSVSGAGWVGESGGGRFTLRRATLAAGAIETLEASWSAAPLVESIQPGITWRSDSAPQESIEPLIALSPSFAAWADGLAEPGPGDDPDGDDLANLLEYALGGDPESGAMQLPNGEPARPVLTLAGGVASYRFPERIDAAERGLDYSVEFSSDLSGGSWTSTPPPGLSSNAVAYDPPLAGFVKRSVSWPVDDDFRFARLVVTLNE